MNNVKLLVSVIINCYNGEKFVREAIDSVVAQTYDNWELIFWDNQSTDSTASIVKSYNDSRIKYFYAPEHTRLGKARNYALNKAVGEYIIFLDVDDLWDRSCLDEFVKCAEQHIGFGLFFSRFINDNGLNKWYSNNNKFEYEVSTDEFVRKYYVGMSATFFKRSVIIDNNIQFNENFSLIEDFDFFIRIRSVTKAWYIPSPLMTYSIHGGNLSNSSNWVNEFNELCFLIENGMPGYDKLFPYINRIKARRNSSIIKQLLRDNKRKQAIHYAIQSIRYDITYVKTIVLIVLGEENIMAIKKIMLKK